jgi:O-antigen/teichoic acid export membrane protein
MARVLDYESYGSYGQVLLITAFVAALLSFGLSQIIYVYLNKSVDVKSVLSSNIFAAFLLGVFGVLLLVVSSSFFASWLNNPSIGKLILVYSFSLLFTLPNQSINSFLIFTNKVKWSTFLIVFTNLLKVVLVVYFIQTYKSVYLALLGIVLSQIVQFLIGLYFVRKSIGITLDKELMLEQLKKGFPLGLTGVLGAGILYIDGIMVSKLEGVQAFAIYRNGAIEVPFIATIYGSIATIILPEVSKLFSEHKFKEIVELKRKVIMNTIMLTYPILVFLLFNTVELITTYLGKKYEASAIIFLVYNLTLLMRVNDYHDILISANKSKYILYYYIVVFLVNVIFNYLFIYWLGSIGAAISTVMSLFLFAFLHMNKSLSIINARFFDLIDFKDVIKMLVFTFSLAFFLNFSLSNFIVSPYKLVLFGIIFFPLTYFFLFQRNLISKELFRRILSKN